LAIPKHLALSVAGCELKCGAMAMQSAKSAIGRMLHIGSQIRGRGKKNELLGRRIYFKHFLAFRLRSMFFCAASFMAGTILIFRALIGQTDLQTAGTMDGAQVSTKGWTMGMTLDFKMDVRSTRRRFSMSEILNKLRVKVKCGIECCRINECIVCPYHDNCYSIDEALCETFHMDIEAYIQQLERERDAAVEQLKAADMEDCLGCDHCKHSALCETPVWPCNDCDNEECPCHTCFDGSNWNWIGVQEVE
jgi:hypothetical protein